MMGKLQGPRGVPGTGTPSAGFMTVSRSGYYRWIIDATVGDELAFGVAGPTSLDVAAMWYAAGNFGIILDDFSRVSQLFDTPHAPCNILEHTLRPTSAQCFRVLIARNPMACPILACLILASRTSVGGERGLLKQSRNRYLSWMWTEMNEMNANTMVGLSPPPPHTHHHHQGRVGLPALVSLTVELYTNRETFVSSSPSRPGTPLSTRASP